MLYTEAQAGRFDEASNQSSLVGRFRCRETLNSL